MVESEQKRKAAATVCILQHIHCETLGIILDCLQSAGIEMRFVRTFERNPIPSNLDAQAGLIHADCRSIASPQHHLFYQDTAGSLICSNGATGSLTRFQAVFRNEMHMWQRAFSDRGV